MKFYRWVVILLLSFSILSCAKARTYYLYLRYQPSKEFPSLQQKIGPTLGIAPFIDERPDPSYIGIYNSLQGISSYFKSEPFPLEKAIEESLTEVLSREGVKTVAVSQWDGEPKSLETMETDAVLMVKIKRFWAEGRTTLFKTNIKTSIQLTVLLGVKKERKVFTKNVAVDKEMTVMSFSPQKVRQAINETLTEIFDAFFSDPY
jgi:hypothetical protein